MSIQTSAAAVLRTLIGLCITSKLGSPLRKKAVSSWPCLPSFFLVFPLLAPRLVFFGQHNVSHSSHSIWAHAVDGRFWADWTICAFWPKNVQNGWKTVHSLSKRYQYIWNNLWHQLIEGSNSFESKTSQKNLDFRGPLSLLGLLVLRSTFPPTTMPMLIRACIQ